MHTGSFYRSAIPADIKSGSPDPSGWGTPVAQIMPNGCDFSKFFNHHRIVFGKCIPMGIMRRDS